MLDQCNQWPNDCISLYLIIIEVIFDVCVLKHFLFIFSINWPRYFSLFIYGAGYNLYCFIKVLNIGNLFKKYFNWNQHGNLDSICFIKLWLQLENGHQSCSWDTQEVKIYRGISAFDCAGRNSCSAHVGRTSPRKRHIGMTSLIRLWRMFKFK